MRRILPNLVGNDGLRARLGAGLTAQVPDVSHAYIIEGAKGMGKHTFAVNFAAALCCEHRLEQTHDLPCGKCPACRKIFSGISPDVIEIGREDKASLGIDSIRGLRQDVHIYPNDLDRKIYIINDADTMTPQAQNAFLLTLEEPPSYAVFLLLCENSHELLETVRSRAPVLRMQPLTAEQTAQVVLDRMPEAEDVKRRDERRFYELTAASGGCAGKAILLLSDADKAKEADRIMALREHAAKFCQLCADSRQGAQAMNNLIGGKAVTRDEASEMLETIRLALRDLTLLKRDADAPMLFFVDRERAVELSDSYSLRRLLTLCDSVADAISSLDRNMNVRLTLMKMLSVSGMFD